MLGTMLGDGNKDEQDIVPVLIGLTLIGEDRQVKKEVSRRVASTQDVHSQEWGVNGHTQEC